MIDAELIELLFAAYKAGAREYNGRKYTDRRESEWEKRLRESFLRSACFPSTDREKALAAEIATRQAKVDELKAELKAVGARRFVEARESKLDTSRIAGDL
jgi:hypothetical protein